MIISLKQQSAWVFIDNLYDQVLSICGMPFTDNGRAGNHATGMVALVDNGWYQADTVARNTEDIFRESNAYFDEIATSILREKGLLDINPVNFKLNFPRNETANVQSKAQAAQIMLAMGMHPELAFKKSGVSNDPVADVKMSEKFLKMIWGDPDRILSMGEEDALEYAPEDPQQQAREDEQMALIANRRPDPSVSKNDTDGRPGTRTYYRVRNGKKEKVSAYTKKAKVNVQ